MENFSNSWKNFFPYKIRPSQEVMIKFLSENLKNEKHAVIESPNGTGKTIASLASVLPFAKRKNKKIIYLARTHSQMDRVMEELLVVNEIMPVSGIVMRSRTSMCLNKFLLQYAKDSSSASEICHQLKKSKKCSYYLNLSSKKDVQPLLRSFKRKTATTEIILKVTKDRELCPAEFSRLLLKEVDVIACSYLYIFDRNIRENFLDTLELELNDLILIVDEAHNLPETALNIASETITIFSLSRAIREARDANFKELILFFETVSKMLETKSKLVSVNKEMPLDAGKFLEEIELKLEDDNFNFDRYGGEFDETFFIELMNIGAKIRNKRIKEGKDPISSIGKIGSYFYFLFESLGSNSFLTTVGTKQLQDKSYYSVLQSAALDPRAVLQEPLSDCYLSIHMSGTINGLDAYTKLIGLNRLKPAAQTIPSPYKKENIAVYTVNRLSSLYTLRSQSMYEKIVNTILLIVKYTPGNIGVFAPSYAFLQSLLKVGLKQKSTKPVFEVKANMKSQENDQLIQKFKREAERNGGVLCSVLGGRSSEGTDFKGKLMDSVCIVGIPFAPPTPHITAQINFFENEFPLQGKRLVYERPAFNRASQAAGRAVRSQNDRAFIAFLDFRYGEKRSQKFLPDWLKQNNQSIDIKDVEHKIKEFFVTKI